MKKVVSIYSLIFFVLIIYIGYLTFRLRDPKVEYYRGVWNACLYGVISKTTPENAKKICAEAYWDAIDQNWYNAENWPSVPTPLTIPALLRY